MRLAAEPFDHGERLRTLLRAWRALTSRSSCRAAGVLFDDRATRPPPGKRAARHSDDGATTRRALVGCDHDRRRIARAGCMIEGMEVELLVVPDCPHDGPARELLRMALADVGLGNVRIRTTVIDS